MASVPWHAKQSRTHRHTTFNHTQGEHPQGFAAEPQRPSAPAQRLNQERNRIGRAGGVHLGQSHAQHTLGIRHEPCKHLGRRRLGS